MNRAFQIFRRDLKRLLHNPVALVITIGVCVIPSLYAWYNVVANWDPYGNTAGVKVAVANLDTGTSNEYVGKMNAGKQVMDQLKLNDQLGWTFVDADAAKEGVERGDYYAAIIIPKDFSENLTSMLTGEYTQPKLEYYVNEKKNAIAPKVTDTGASTIQEQINETFVSTVSKTLVTQLDEKGGDVIAQGDAAGAGLLGGVEKAKDALGQVRDSLSGMQGTIDTTKDAIASADGTLAQLNDTLPQLTQALAQGDELLSTTRQTSRDFATSLTSALSKGGVALGKASAQANASVGKVAGVIVNAQTVVDGQLSSAQGVIDDLDSLISLIENQDWIDNTARKDVLDTLMGTRDAMQTVHDGLATQSDDIKNTATSVAGATDSIDNAVQTSLDEVGKAQESISANALPKLSSGLDAFSSVGGDLKGVVASLSPVIQQARGTLGELSSTLDQAKTAITQTGTTLGKIQETLDSAATDIRALRSSEALDQLGDLMNMDGDEVADFMASPVELKTETIYPVSNYGSGVAPFYTNLALWVGGFVLIAIYKLEVDREGVGTFTANQGYFGRWLLLVLLGFVQALIVCVGDLVIGVQCGQPVLFVLAGIWTSFVYVNIIYALSITFKHIGKALGVILVIVQIPGSSGMYPIEMMPRAFQFIHPFLPFTYGINAMRETIGGMYGLSYLFNLAVLAIFLVVALVIGTWLRPLFLNLNLLFDRQLSRTGVMICEKDDLPNQRYSVRTAMRVLLDVKEFRHELVGRATRFEHRYPSRVRLGFALIVLLPVVQFAVINVFDFTVDGKIAMLVLWIVAIILVCAYLINLEYVRESLNTQMRVSSLTDEGLRAEIREHTDMSQGAARVFGVHLPARGKHAAVPTIPVGGEAAQTKVLNEAAEKADADAMKGGEDA